MPGIGRRTAEVVIAEIGVDMSRFPTSGHLASWAGLCPGHHESAGKQRSGKARKGNAALPSALCEAALSAAAFEVFTIGIGSWWDADKHILRAPLARMEFQPWVGGRTIDHGTDGTTCAWTRILAYEPPHRVVFSRDITTTWEIETDPAKTSEVEITFDALHTRPHPGRVDPPPPRPPQRRLGRHSRRHVIEMEPRRAHHHPR